MRNAASSVEDEEERDVCFFGLDLVDFDLDFCLAIVLFGELGLFGLGHYRLFGSCDSGSVLAGRGHLSPVQYILYSPRFARLAAARGHSP